MSPLHSLTTLSSRALTWSQLNSGSSFAPTALILEQDRYYLAHWIPGTLVGLITENIHKNMEDKDLEASLVATVKELFSGPSREDLSVNTVRTKCEKKHDLEDGFFAKGEWKTKSKEIIKNQVVCHPFHLYLPT